MNTLNVYIFLQYIFSHISHMYRVLDVHKFDVSTNYDGTNGINLYVHGNITTQMGLMCENLDLGETKYLPSQQALSIPYLLRKVMTDRTQHQQSGVIGPIPGWCLVH